MPPKKKKSTAGHQRTNGSKFVAGEKVWCLWNYRYYEAKILHSVLQIDGDKYYDVHYYKFSKKWDMPVNEKRLLSFTKENSKLAKKTNKEFSLAQKKKRLNAKLKQEILDKIAEKPLKEQSPFLKLTDMKHTGKSFDVGHVSVGESISTSSLQSSELTDIVICDNDELKNLSTKSLTQTVEPVIKENEQDINVGLVKSLSSEEKDSINDFDNLFNTMKTQSNFNQQKNQEDKIDKSSIEDVLSEIDNPEYDYIADDTVMSTDVHECLDDSEQQVIAAFIEDMNNKQYNENREISDTFILNNTNISNNEDAIGSTNINNKELNDNGIDFEDDTNLIFTAEINNIEIKSNNCEKINRHEEELLLRNEDNIINSDNTVDNKSSYEVHYTSNVNENNPSRNDIFAITEESYTRNNLDGEINHLDEVVTQKKKMLDDQENNGIVDDNLSYEALNTSSIKESNPSETTNIIITSVVSHSDNILDGKNDIDETSHFSEEVTSQHKFINSVNFNSEPSCCSINKIFKFCNNGACRVSSVSIVTEMPGLEKNLDNINRSILNENNSSGSASLIVTTALLNNENKLSDGEKNEKKIHQSTVPIKLENLINPLIIDHEYHSIISNIPDFEVSGTPEMKNSNPSRNVSLIVTTTALSNNENNLDNEGKNIINENNKKQQNPNVPIKLENMAVDVQQLIIPEDTFTDEVYLSGIASSSASKTNKRKINEFDDETTESNLNIKSAKVSSTSSTRKEKMNDHEGQTTDCHNGKNIKGNVSTKLINKKRIENYKGKSHVKKGKMRNEHKKNDFTSNDNSSVYENIHCVTPCLPTLTNVASNEKNINCYEDKANDENDQIKKSKVHMKHKNKISKDLISNKDSIKKKKNSVIIPSSPTSKTVISNKRQINYSEGEATVDDHIKKKTKVKKKCTIKISNDINIYADQDNFGSGNCQQDVTPNDSSTLNKINHSISKSLSASTSTLTNHKIKMTKGDHFKKENTCKKHKKKAKNIDIHVNQNNGFDLPSFDNLNENSHSMIPSTSTIITNSQSIIIDHETSTENNDDSLYQIKMSEQSSSSSSSPSNKIKINDFGDETSDGDNCVKNIDIRKKHKKMLSTDVDFDKDHFQLEAVTINNKKCHDHEEETSDEDDHVRKSKVFKKHQKQKSKDVYLNSEYGLVSNQLSIEDWSYSSSSLSLPLLNRQLQSDEDIDIDGQTTEDDDQYVKTRKVSNKKLKSCDIDHNIYELFAYEKPYSRAAKVKANEAISQMSKPPLGKEKKNDAGKRTKSGKKKDDEDPSYVHLTLGDFDLDIPRYIRRILIEDKHLIEDDRFIPILPAKLTVYQILCDYAAKFPVCRETLDMVFDAFNMSLPFWLLHPLEKPKSLELSKKYPDRPMCKIYGLPHLLRFIMKLPKLFFMLRSKKSNDFIPLIVHFMRGLFIYLVDEDFQISILDYDSVMPDYYRMAYFST